MSGVSHFAMVGYDVVLSGGSQISQMGGGRQFFPEECTKLKEIRPGRAEPVYGAQLGAPIIMSQKSYFEIIRRAPTRNHDPREAQTRINLNSALCGWKENYQLDDKTTTLKSAQSIFIIRFYWSWFCQGRLKSFKKLPSSHRQTDRRKKTDRNTCSIIHYQICTNFFQSKQTTF